LIYSAPCPARFGFAATALLPSAPWHAAQTVSAVCLALARSGLAAPCAEAFPVPNATTASASAAMNDVRSIPVSLPADMRSSARRAAPERGLRPLGGQRAMQYGEGGGPLRAPGSTLH